MRTGKERADRMKEYIVQAIAQETIASFDAHNAPEITRCKDCIYWQDNNDGYPHIGCKWREDETPDPDDFCSAGERRSE